MQAGHAGHEAWSAYVVGRDGPVDTNHLAVVVAVGRAVCEHDGGPATADAGGCRVEDGVGERGCDGCVHRVASLFQHEGAGLGRTGMAR